MKIKLTALLSALFLFVSCSSTKGFRGKADFCGILTDTANHEISGYTVCINGNQKCITNESGVFVFPEVASQNIKITGYKNGYEKINTEAFFYDENNFVCLTVKSREEVIAEIEHSLEQNDLSKTNELIDSINYDESDDMIIFLKSIVSYLNHEYRKAERLISKISCVDENVEMFRKILKKEK